MADLDYINILMGILLVAVCRMEIIYGIQSQAIEACDTPWSRNIYRQQSILKMALDLRKWTFAQFYPELVVK